MGGSTHALVAYHLLLCEDAKCTDGHQSMSPAFEIIANDWMWSNVFHHFFVISSSKIPERSP
jgi:hypothetical protein